MADYIKEYENETGDKRPTFAVNNYCGPAHGEMDAWIERLHEWLTITLEKRTNEMMKAQTDAIKATEQNIRDAKTITALRATIKEKEKVYG